MHAQPVVVDVPERLTATYLEKIGNIDDLRDQYGQTYRFIRRSVRAAGIVLHSAMAVKLYHMMRETEPLPSGLVSGLTDFVESEISTGRIEPKQRIGFAILSQGFLSLSVWGRGNVLFMQTYTVERNPPSLSPEPLAKTGIACTWEQKIIGYEHDLWNEYLQSSMKAPDKIRYLTTFLTGRLY